jgi:hypothetical protein
VKHPFLFMTLSLALLAGCGQAPVSPIGAAMTPEAVAEAEAAKSLSGKIKARFRGFFDRLDANNDKKWTATDFKMDEKRFLNCFRSIDTDNDEDVEYDEYYPKERHDELILTIQSRAKVFLMSDGKTRVSFDDVFDNLDAYLKPYLPQRERKKESKEAFGDADANNDDYLNKSELAFCLGIMECKAMEKYIERQVNRSNGQPAKK